MYSQNMQTAGRRRSIRGSASSSWGGRRKKGTEQVRLVQLVICLALFLVILLGRGAFPQKMEQMWENILTLISTDLNLRESLSSLGESLAGNDSMLSDFGAFCVEVFGTAPQEDTSPEEVSFTPPQPADVLAAELKFLSQNTTAAGTAHYADFSRFGLAMPALESEPEEIIPTDEPEMPEEAPVIPAAGMVVMVSDYSGDALPNNYTMDQLSLGDLETMTPVLGRLNSTYGYRDHPISGKYLFHGGVDIGGQMGDPIAAFAAGTVEYTGEDDSYGLYLQVDHGNGVKSFYAHCSKIVVTKGQEVAIGEKVAEIGSTGNSTGPHLHLELKYNKMHLNPAYYVDFLEQ